MRIVIVAEGYTCVFKIITRCGHSDTVHLYSIWYLGTYELLKSQLSTWQLFVSEKHCMTQRYPEFFNLEKKHSTLFDYVISQVEIVHSYLKLNIIAQS